MYIRARISLWLVYFVVERVWETRGTGRRWGWDTRSGMSFCLLRFGSCCLMSLSFTYIYTCVWAYVCAGVHRLYKLLCECEYIIDLYYIAIYRRYYAKYFHCIGLHVYNYPYHYHINRPYSL